MDLSKLNVIVKEYIRMSDGVVVIFNVEYEEFEQTFQSESVPVDKKKVNNVLKRAFKTCKKNIKSWVNGLDASVVGRRLPLSAQDLADSEPENEPVL
jgi:hypothetical protein